MPLYPGLLISTAKNEERSASSEIHFILTNRLGIEESSFRIRDTRISGLITVGLDDDMDPSEIISRLIRLEDDQAYFMHCLKIRPIARVIDADVDTLVDAIREENIQRHGSFRISVNKRHSPISSMDIIKPVAALFSNPVDLDSPSWEIWIEIVADRLGYAVIEPEMVFSTQLAYQDQDDDVPNWFLD